MADETTILARLKTIAQTVSGIDDARIVLGLADIGASTDWWRQLDDSVSTTGGPYLVILPFEMTGMNDARNAEVETLARLYTAVAKDAAQELTTQQTLVCAVRDAWLLASNFSDCPAPTNIRYSRPQLVMDRDPVRLMWEFTLSFLVC